MPAKKRKQKIITFSEYYKMGKSQMELDFVDVPVNGPDILLFIDPYALARRNDPWFKACADEVYGFFDHLLDLIRLNQKSEAMKLLNGLHESNETKLGYSPRNQGAGVGLEQSGKLYAALRNSPAVLTGILKDIEEVNLMIPGIDRDKVSDITTNIIKKHLIKYTQDQCELHGLDYALIDRPVKNIFNYDLFLWDRAYHRLPGDMKGHPIILVPKAIVRIIPSLNAREYYQHYVLNYLQAELYSAGSSLGRLLKDGSRAKPSKTVITEEVTHVGDGNEEGKKTLKDFLREFSSQHQNILEEYEEVKKKQSRPLLNEGIEKQNKNRHQDYDELIEKLSRITPGKKAANDYHDYMIGALSAIFYPLLTKPKKEQPINDGIKRIDISFINSADYGFFSGLRELKGIPAPYVIFECKNYWKELGNPEVDQLATRFNPTRGKLGFLTYRDVESRARLVSRCKKIASDDHGFIIPLSDIDIIALLQLKRDGKDNRIDALLEEKLREVIDWYYLLMEWCFSYFISQFRENESFP